MAAHKQSSTTSEIGVGKIRAITRRAALVVASVALLGMLPAYHVTDAHAQIPSPLPGPVEEAAQPVDVAPSGQGKPFTYEIVATIAPTPDTLADTGETPRPLAAVTDDSGIKSIFVANELLVTPAGPDELNDLLARYGARVIGSTAIPDPPPGVDANPALPAPLPISYVVEVDPSAFSLEDLAADEAALRIGGALKFSSEDAARLVALSAHEHAEGRAVDLNFVAESTGFPPTITTEQADGRASATLSAGPSSDRPAARPT